MSSPRRARDEADMENSLAQLPWTCDDHLARESGKPAATRRKALFGACGR